MSDFLHEEEAIGKAYDLQILRRLWPYVRPYWRQVLITLGLVAPMLLMELAPAWVIKLALDQATASSAAAATAVESGAWLARIVQVPDGVSPWLWFGVLYGIVILAGTGLQFLNMVVMVTTGQSAMRDLRREVFAHIQKLHLGFFDSYPVGRLVTRTTNDVENVAEMFSAGIVAFVTDVIRMIGIAVVLYLLDPDLAVMTLAVVPVLAVAAIIFRLKVREAFRVVRVRIARINAHIQETVTGIKVVQLFTREERNLRDFTVMNAGHRDAWQKSIHYDALLFASVEAAQGVTLAVILWFGTVEVADAGLVYVFIDWTRRFFMPLRDLSQKYSVMQSSMASSERLLELIDTEPAIKDPAEPQVAFAEAARGSVEFEHVWFSYAGEDASDDAWILRDVSFRVAPGDRVAFVGATGAGKTTLIKLLTRLYEVTRGRILVDGVDIRAMDQGDLRRRIATVLQDVFLFSGSVTDNLALGRGEVSRETVVRAAKAVEIDTFISSLSDGYDTEVRERGTNFSSGQRQLLSFARALVHGADILVLDEATSSIDTETEALVQQGIHVLLEGRTAIAIAHRLSTIRDMHCIHVLDRGRLVESGSHEELVAARGVYHRLYRLQRESRAEAALALASA
ncbi:MAG: ABC transporter ATP-binding protein [Myxococcota bacterium]|nr:ABC transporter ATP-binding protein [Myxococcota bacterium]